MLGYSHGECVDFDIQPEFSVGKVTPGETQRGIGGALGETAGVALQTNAVLPVSTKFR